MRIMVYYPGRCQDCGKSVPLNEAKYGEKDIPGGHRIFRVCPYCGHEINNKVGPVDDNGNPIPTETEREDNTV